MDKNQVTGLILISLLLFAYYYFFAPEPQPVQPEEEPAEVIQDKPVVMPEDTVIQDATPALTKSDLADSISSAEFGPFTSVLKGEDSEVVVENEFFELTFSTRGGNVKKVVLKEFKTWDDRPLVLLDGSSSAKSEVVETEYGKLDLSKIYFDPEVTTTSVSGSDTLTLRFKATLTGGDQIIKSYQIPGNRYTIIQDIQLEDIRDDLTSNTLLYTWNNNLRKLEKDLKTSQVKSTINYYTAAEDFDNLSESSSEFEEETLNEPVKWIAFKQKFFTAGIIGIQPFDNAYVSSNPVIEDPEAVKSCVIRLNVSLDDYQQGYLYYYGPNNYQILKKVTEGFSKNIYLGWPPVVWVNKFLIIPTFQFLERFMSNYGIIIMLLVVFIKIILFPLTYKSYISMAKTKVLKPELDEIKKQYEGDMQKVQSEQMKLYQQVGVNPLSGCIPLLLQMPILLSMFYFFPNSIELRQEAFLWADDLSTFDSIMSLPFTIPAYGDHVSLFTLLMTGSTILYTWSNSQVSSVQGPMKSMQYFMPLVFMFVLNSFPAALSYYYFVSNIVTFGQQALIRKFVDEEKIKKILDENRKKSSTKKKSKFQQRLEEAMKASEDTKKRKKK